MDIIKVKQQKMEEDFQKLLFQNQSNELYYLTQKAIELAGFIDFKFERCILAEVRNMAEEFLLVQHFDYLISRKVKHRKGFMILYDYKMNNFAKVEIEIKQVSDCGNMSFNFTSQFEIKL